MKTAPGSPKAGSDILDREKEIAELWRLLARGSVLFTAERRVGKSCILQKMSESPPPAHAVIKCDVEACRHPSDLVGKMFDAATQHALLSRQAQWLARFNRAYELSCWMIPS